MEDYKTSIKINHSKKKIFDAISKELTEWWGKQDHQIDKEGMEFTVSWGEPWYQFSVIHFKENEALVWKCIDANQKIKGIKHIEKEWVNTEIHWEIEKISNELCKLNFKHIGLNKGLLCFNFCSQTWNHFLNDSLVSYLDSKI